MNPIPGNPIQTLKINEKEQSELISAINALKYDVGADPDRLWVTAVQSNAVLSIYDHGNTEIQYEVLAYSHSRQGIRVIHGRYIHPDKYCKIRFQSINGDWHERVGSTGQCVHAQGMIHALLINFDQPINLDEYALLTSDQETRHLQEIASEMPSIEDQEFVGVVSKALYVDDQNSDRKLMNHWLSRAGMQVVTVGSIDSANDRLEEDNFHIMIVDMLLGHKEGSELIREARSDGFVQPIVAVSADESQQMKDKALAAGADAFMCKPLNNRDLIYCIKELLGIDPESDNSPIYSVLNQDPEMVPLLTGYVRSLVQQVHNLHEAITNQNYETIERIATRLKGSAESYGYPQATSSAAEVLSSLHDSSADMDQIKRQTNALIQVLSRIRLNRPQDPDHSDTDDTTAYV